MQSCNYGGGYIGYVVWLPMEKSTASRWQRISPVTSRVGRKSPTRTLWLSPATVAGYMVFFHSTYNAGTYVTHVGIYVGNNQMYRAGDPIGYADLNNSYWQQHLIGAGRVKQ